MLKYLVNTFIVLIILCSCSKENINITENQISFNIVDSTIFRFEGLNTLNITDSLIYISDYFNYSIHCCDFEGKQKFEFGSKGKGPGEFSFPGDIAVKDNKLAILNSTENKIELFDINGNYLKTLRLDFKFPIIGFTSFFFCNNDLYFETIKKGIFEKDLTEKIITCKFHNLNKLEIIKTQMLNSIKIKYSYPIQIYSTLFPYKNSFIEVENDKNIIIKNTRKNFSLLSIPNTKVSKKIKQFIKETNDYEDTNIKFPTFFPRVLNVFEIQDKLFILSFSQYYNNLINLQNNFLYYYDDKNNVFKKMELPNYMPVSKLEIVKSNIMVFVDRENEEVFIFKIKIY